MKKFTLLLFVFTNIVGFSQQKTTGDIILSASQNIIANFTLDNSTSKVTLILKGPSDRWFALGMGPGIVSGFGMSAGDLVVYSTSLTDRNYIGFVNPAVDASQDWSVISDMMAGAIRTLVLERNLTNSDTTGSDLQFPFATTSAINLVCAFPNSATTTLAGGHGRAYATGTFTTLGSEDFFLKASSIYPNPSNGTFRIQTKTALTKVNVYGQTGNFIKTIEVKDNSQDVEVNLKGVATGIYLLELQNENEKSWKKIIVE